MSFQFPDIPGYAVGAELGRGAVGAVFAATHEATGANVAIKMVLPADERARAALHNEVLAMARLNHPNLLFLHDTGIIEGPDPVVWMAMEKASGGSLQDWRPSSWSSIEEVLDPLLAGLAYAHAHGVVHRDLKPANLLMATPADPRPGLKIADFGLTAIRDVGTTYRRGGTPHYMPPEQARSDLGEPGPWSDIYALGAVLWRWVCGGLYHGPTDQIMRSHVHAPLPRFAPRFEVPDAVAGVLTRMLSKAPGERPSSIAQVRQALSRRSRTAAQAFDHAAQTAGSARLPGIGANLIPLRDWRLIGRAAERRLLVDALGAMQTRGTASVCLISGPTGIGKTRLMRWLAETAAEAGVAHLMWRPTDSGAVLAQASRGPVVACFDDLDAPSEACLAMLAFAKAPILAVATCRNAQDWPDLDVLPGFLHLRLAPMQPADFREFLTTELGVLPRISARMDAACGRVPGVATAWMAQLSREGALTPGPNGYVFELGDQPVAPQLDAPLDEGAERMLDALSDVERSGLRVAALCGRVVRADVLAESLQRLGRSTPRAAVERLAQAGWILPDAAGFQWVGDSVVERILRPDGTAAEHDAIAEALAVLDPSPQATLLRARHLVAAGRFEAARKLVLVRERASTQEGQERLHEAVELLRGHMAGASAEQRACLMLMEVQVLLNLVSEGAAKPAADALVAAVGMPGQPGTLGPDVSDGLRQEALEFVVLVYVFGGHEAEADAILAVLPETSRTLRARGMLLTARGDLDGSIALQERAIAMVDSSYMVARLANGLGVAHGRAGRHEQAINWFRIAALQLDEGVERTARQNTALSLMALGLPWEALTEARAAFELPPFGGVERSVQGVQLYATIAALADSDADVDRVADLATYLMQRFEVAPALPVLAQKIELANPGGPSSRAFLAVLRARTALGSD